MTAASNEGTPFGLIAAGVVGNKLDRKTRALLGRGDGFRTGEKVWRNSYTEGQIEPRIWRPLGIGKQRGTVRGGKRWAAAVLMMAKRFEIRTRAERQDKEPGARNGALGGVAIAVLEYLYDLVDFATGRLEPAIATIAEEIGHSYSAVHEALCRLRRQGFLQWIRRSKPTGNKGEAGPQVEQISNAYALVLPDEIEGIVRRLVYDGPAPADELERREQARRDWKAMVDQLSATAFHADHWQGDRLAGETVARIAALLDAREKQERESGRNGETGGSS